MRANKNYSIKDIQSKILSIAKYLDAFCRDNGIEYYLMGGSALGAMRHQGFIPWDDDLDVFMTVENYDRFLNVFPQKGDMDKYYLQKQDTEEWPLLVSQVCLKNTTLISSQFANNLKKHHNVFVDVMCLYSAPNSKGMRWIQYMAAQLLRVNALQRCRLPQKNIAKKILMLLSSIIVNPITKPLLVKYIRHYEGKGTSFVGHYFGRARFKNATFPREFVGQQRYVYFEDTKLPVFEHVEDYLVARFGEKWMEMPDADTIARYPQHGDYVDLKQNYTEYLTTDKKHWSINFE